MRNFKFGSILFVMAVLLSSCSSGANEKVVEEPKVEELKLESSKNVLNDPVCKMEVDASGADSSVYEGKTYHFCSPNCKADFDKDPKTYANK